MTDKTANPGKPGADGAPLRLIAGMLVLSAAAIAVIGSLVPGWLGFEAPLATWISLVFYVVAAGDLLIALWFWRRQAKPAEGGGAVKRQ